MIVTEWSCLAEAALLLCRPTSVYYQCYTDNYRLPLTVLRLMLIFHRAKTHRKRSSPTSGAAYWK
jgi:hypothetical protein